ncbi:magnesium-translocating P-type ATPase [Xanthobacter aminoxidans]|uniref:Magnesium-transporting ATPase, P-type 1 n=1 Tax=Xanthobacter aminoxidans TaxID=186280 RepID=A0ABW6ZM44_9HYPH
MAGQGSQDEASPVGSAPVDAGTAAFWTEAPDALCRRLTCGTTGLSSAEAAERLDRFGPNLDKPPSRSGPIRALLRRLLEPLILMLLVAAGVSAATGDAASAAIIILVIVASIGLDTVQEARASKAAAALREQVALTAEVCRDGVFCTLPTDRIVPGDVFRVRTGDIIPADAVILSSDGFAANEAALTGEPYAVEKRPGAVSSTVATNALFRGAVAQSGEAVALAVATGRSTLFGAAAALLAEDSALSPFQRDLRALGFVIARAAGVLSVAVLAVNLVLGRPLLESLMFAVALAVGLTPELLPMITTVTLSRGAVRMAQRKVIVKRLTAIHDLGAMTVLCTDKTGTLTSAEIVLAGSEDASGQATHRPAELAALCAELAGDRSWMDTALAAAAPDAADGWSAPSRLGFGYERRRGSVLAERAGDGAGERLLVCKGAPEAVMDVCTSRRIGDAIVELDAEARAAIATQLKRHAEQGLRAIAIATRAGTPDGMARTGSLEPEDESGLVLEGFCLFEDPPKPTAAHALARLRGAGVRVKVLSGDDPTVVARVAGELGIDAADMLSGAEVAHLSDDALRVRVRSVNVFGRMTPNQKVRVVRALMADGETVGFLGDGVNDAPGLKLADVGLSVDGATGVARAAADMILLAPDLDVVADGVEEGRRTFANILKYVRMGASSNFGNMLSMAAASLFLPFLPLLATQILLNNLLYDLSEVGIPFDAVDEADLATPQQWDMKGLVRFAAVMGPLSSLFDFLTFAVLLLVLGAGVEAFRTAWFLESIATQVLVVFLIRTRLPLGETPPDRTLIISALGALTVAFVVPLSGIGGWFGFVPLPATTLAAVAGITLVYLACAQRVKRYAVGVAPTHGRAGGVG